MKMSNRWMNFFFLFDENDKATNKREREREDKK